MEGEEGRGLPLQGVIGFNGGVPSGLLLHPDDQHILFPLGSTIVVKNLVDHSQRFLNQDGHDQSITCAALSRDGTKLASGQQSHLGFPALVVIWDVQTGKSLHKLNLHKGRVQALAFSASGRYLATLGGIDDKRVIIWDVETGDTVGGASASNELSTCVTWVTGSDSELVIGGLNKLRLWSIDRENRKLRSTDVAMGSVKRNLTCLAVDEAGETLYAGTTTGDVLQISLKSCVFLQKGPEKLPFGNGLNALMLTRDGHLVAGCGDGTVAVLNCETMKTVRKMKLEGNVTSLALNKAGDHFFVGTLECNIFLVHLESLEHELTSTCHMAKINDVVFAANYSELFATCSSNDIRIWNARTRQELLRIQVPTKECLCVAFSHDGKLVLSGWSDGKIRAFLPQSGKLKWEINDAHAGGVTALVGTKNSRAIVSGGQDGQVRVWSVDGGAQRMVASLKEHKNRVNSIQLNESDTECISAASDGSCIVWSLERFARISALFASTQFRDARYHPDQSQLLTTGTDRKITYWDAVDGQAIRIMDGSPSAEINSLDITHDGERFVSAGSDRLVRVWGYDAGFCYRVGVGHSGAINRVRLAPDQSYAVSVGSEGAIFIWDVPAGKDAASDARPDAAPAPIEGQ